MLIIMYNTEMNGIVSGLGRQPMLTVSEMNGITNLCQDWASLCLYSTEMNRIIEFVSRLGRQPMFVVQK